MILRILIFILLAAAAEARTFEISKQGQGNITVKSRDGQINCGAVCSADEALLSNPVRLYIERDASLAYLLGWGGICESAERRTECTIDLTKPIWQVRPLQAIAVAGYWQNGICRIYGGNPHLYYNDLQTAYNVVQSGAGSGPIECVVNQALTLTAGGTLSVEISGGWVSFAPNEAPPAGSLSRVTGPLTVTTGKLIITGTGGIEIR